MENGLLNVKIVAWIVIAGTKILNPRRPVEKIPVYYLNEKMMKTVTASQQPVFTSIKENLECIMDVLETHKTSDWILTPEGSLSGYCANVCHEGTEEQKKEYFTALDKIETYLIDNKRNLALGTGHYEQDGFAYNQVRYYAEGRLVSAYNKQRLTRTKNGLGEYYYYMMGQNQCARTVHTGIAQASLVTMLGRFQVHVQMVILSWTKYAEHGCSNMFVSANCSTDEFDHHIHMA